MNMELLLNPNKVIAATDVFCHLGANRLTKEDVVSEGQELWATPMNVMEIVSGINPKKWDDRRRAASAIVEFADKMAPDPENHVCALIARQEWTPGFFDDWFDGVHALSMAKSFSDLRHGVFDPNTTDTLFVDTAFPDVVKGKFYKEFNEGIVAACEKLVPGYREAADKGLPPEIDETEKNDLQDLFKTLGIFTFAFNELALRYKELEWANDHWDEVIHMIDRLGGYWIVYGQYLRELLTTGQKPDENDWGNMEMFLYLQEGSLVATSEKKWWNLADNAGIGHCLKKVSPA